MERGYLFLEDKNNGGVVHITETDTARSGETVEYVRRDGKGNFVERGQALLVKPEDTGWEVFSPIGRTVQIQERVGSGPGGEKKIRDLRMYRI